MARSGWTVVILLLFGGCTPKHPTPPAPSLFYKDTGEKNVSDATASADPFCYTLPQTPEIELPELSKKVSDLELFPQTIFPYAERNARDQEELSDIQKKFGDSYYLPWCYEKPPIKQAEAQWPICAFKGGYGSNLQPIDPSWFKEMEVQSNFDEFGSVNQKGATLKWMNIRVFPTDKPLYNNPSLPGEGYPFDLLQNSSVAFNEPIFISHTSKDGSWSYIFTNNASGWVPSDGIVAINEETIEHIREKEMVFITEDRIPLYNEDHRFVTYSRIGMVLPYSSESNESYQVQFVGPDSELHDMAVSKSSARLGISKITKSDLVSLGNQMLRNTYGWGGMFGERDCSSMIRELYTPFGIWLPRNSASQARKGEIIPFSGMSDQEKIETIKAKGVPFETILYKKGHVLLYLGTYQDTVMVLHNIWGIRTIDKEGRKGRRIIGKTVVSTLELGSEIENFDSSQKLLSTLQSMNIFTSPSPLLTQTKKGKRKSKAI